MDLDPRSLSFTSIMACHFDEAVDKGAVIVHGLQGTFLLEQVTWPCALLYAEVDCMIHDLPLGLLKNRVHAQLA